jgi:uncharacterized protein YfaP (DUF2135 family)
MSARAAVGLLILSLSAGGSDAPRVHLRQPRTGWTRQRLIAVQGSVSDRHITTARVSLNGVDRPINVHSGRFEVKLVVPPGENTLEVAARNQAGVGRDSVSFYADVPPTDVLVMLSWDTNETDLDLHVTDPAGEECYYGHRHTAAGGALEVDDTDGFGPEIFAQVRATPGTYRVGVAYYAAAEEPTPTTAIVQVFVRQGTSAERRYRYQAVLNREGDEVELGAFQVDPLSP